MFRNKKEEDYIINPNTGRRIKSNGRLARSISKASTMSPEKTIDSQSETV